MFLSSFASCNINKYSSVVRGVDARSFTSVFKVTWFALCTLLSADTFSTYSIYLIHRLTSLIIYFRDCSSDSDESSSE